MIKTFAAAGTSSSAAMADGEIRKVDKAEKVGGAFTITQLEPAN